MPAPSDQTMKKRARRLRSGMTDEERRLWYNFLRTRPEHFRRQQVLGGYILDFYCHSRGVAIELDGSQHYESDGVGYDQARDAFLRSCGITVLRYSNADINQPFTSVCEDILKHLG